MSYDISREDMIQPIERMFEREYGNAHGMFEVIEEDTEGGEGYVDLLYIQGGSENLHVIRLEETYDGCVFDVEAGGLHTLRDTAANYRWIAIPLHEFREGEDQYNSAMKQECKSRGFGVISLQKKGRGVSAKVLFEPEREGGEFLSEYGDIEEGWDQFTREEGTPEGFRVVEYYEG